jgi:hypothetical protein
MRTVWTEKTGWWSAGALEWWIKTATPHYSNTPVTPVFEESIYGLF